VLRSVVAGVVILLLSQLASLFSRVSAEWG
jgi:hypothetical protein